MASDVAVIIGGCEARVDRSNVPFASGLPLAAGVEICATERVLGRRCCSEVDVIDHDRDEAAVGGGIVIAEPANEFGFRRSNR